MNVVKREIGSGFSKALQMGGGQGQILLPANLRPQRMLRQCYSAMLFRSDQNPFCPVSHEQKGDPAAPGRVRKESWQVFIDALLGVRHGGLSLSHVGQSSWEE